MAPTRSGASRFAGLEPKSRRGLALSRGQREEVAMSTGKFLRARWAQVASWQKNLVAATVAFLLAVGVVTASTVVAPKQFNFVDFSAPGLLVALGWLSICLSLPKFDKWSRRHEPAQVHPRVYYSLTAVLAVLATVYTSLWVADANGMIRAEFFHPKPLVVRINPLLCVNDTPSMGFAAPYPEVLNAQVTEVRSIGVCPHPLNEHFLVIKGWRIGGKEYGAGEQVNFDPPLLLKPGEELEVVVVGRDPYYNLPNSPLYVIRSR